jgi:hypothetical protein
MVNVTWTDAQRKFLFSQLEKNGIDKERIESSLGFSMSEFSKAEASALIDCLTGNGDLTEVIQLIKNKHTASNDQKVDDKQSENAKTNVVATKDQSHDAQEIASEPIDWSVVRKDPEQYVRRLNHIYLHLLQKGTDYGIIPGTQKPTLYKAGAELLSMILGLRTETTEVTEIKEMFGIPMISCSAHTEVLWGEMKIGDGYGSCSSAESKYAFRWVSEGKLPKNIDKEKLYSEEGQYGRRYRVPSSVNEIMDVANTVKKMAIKRSYVDAVLRVTGASRIFTQDLEDMASDK